MTPLHKAFMLSADAVLDRPTLLAIVRSGHSRIPVHRGGLCKEGEVAPCLGGLPRWYCQHASTPARQFLLPPLC